ncbi:hypothetical protein IPF37_04035 [bacterium]|nr:MAG: hypothetical protein IPF37_04035 [bacterium]
MLIKKMMILLGYFLTTTLFPVVMGTGLHSFKKKKLVLLQCKGGYGHVAACNALNNIFKDYYDIKIVTPIEELFDEFDIIKKMTRGKANSEDMYNGILQRGWIRTFNVVCDNIVPFVVRFNYKKMEKALAAYLNREKPDMLISTMPFVNFPASNVAKNLNIPFLIVTVDGGLHNWRVGLKDISHSNYLITIGFDIPQTRGFLHQCAIPDEKIRLTGFAVRNDFFELKDVKAIRKKWAIPDNKFTTMILMGGAGGATAFDYVQKIVSADIDSHVLVCIGRNKKLQTKIARFMQKKSPSNVSVTIIPFTERVSDLMAVSDLLITKPGPGSISEALTMKLPMLLDYTKPALFWERPNMEYVKNNGYGLVIKSLRHVPGILQKMRDDKEYYQGFKQKLEQSSQYNFAQNIKPIVFSMCPPTLPEVNFQLSG